MNARHVADAQDGDAARVDVRMIDAGADRTPHERRVGLGERERHPARRDPRAVGAREEARGLVVRHGRRIAARRWRSCRRPARTGPPTASPRARPRRGWTARAGRAAASPARRERTHARRRSAPAARRCGTRSLSASRRTPQARWRRSRTRRVWEASLALIDHRTAINRNITAIFIDPCGGVATARDRRRHRPTEPPPPATSSPDPIPAPGTECSVPPAPPTEFHPGHIPPGTSAACRS